MVADIKADWALIRERLESGGATQKAIALEFGVTQQAISKRAKAWRSIPTHQTGSRGLASPDRMAAIVDAVGSGLTLSQAAALLKLNRMTVANWRDNNEEFAAAIESAQAKLIQSQISSIAAAGAAGDWRASHTIVKAFDTRFRDTTPGGDRSGPGIVVNIGADRLADAITIEN